MGATGKKQEDPDRVYAPRCGWCKVMDQKTFHHPEVVDYINDRYVAVRFDAEDQSDIQFKGNTHSFVKKGKEIGYHELEVINLCVVVSVTRPSFFLGWNS
ncbi:MAG: DUF255 domain-containing protein [Saprospiraceae bacterium]